MNLLIAIDESSASEACLLAVAARPWPAGTQVRVLSVAPPTLAAAPLPAGGLPPLPTTAAHSDTPANETPGDSTEVARRVASHGMEVLEACGLHVRMRVRHGGAGSEIVDEAHGWPADLIVVGTRDRGALKRTLLGSVADYVMHHAPCSVEVVRARQTI